MDSRFFYDLMKVSPSSVTNVMVQLAISGDLASINNLMDALLEMAHAPESPDAAPGQGAMGAKTYTITARSVCLWLQKQCHATMEAATRDQAPEKRIIASEFVSSTDMSAVEALALVFAPRHDKSLKTRGLQCHPTPLPDEALKVFDRVVSGLRELEQLEQAGSDQNQIKSIGSSFQLFNAYCMASLRCPVAIGKLMALQPDLRSSHMTTGRRIKHDVVSGALTMPVIAIRQMNPVAALSILDAIKRVDPGVGQDIAKKMAKSLEHPGVGNSPYKALLEGLLNETMETVTPKQDPVVFRMLQTLLSQCTREEAFTAYFNTLKSAMEAVTGEFHHPEMAAVVSRLWAMRPEGFIDHLLAHGNASALTSFLLSAASSSHAEVLSHFESTIKGGVIITRDPALNSGKNIQWDMARQCAISASVGKEKIPMPDFIKATELLARAGCDFAGARTAQEEPLLHHMAHISTASADLLQKMLRLVELGCDPMEKNPRGRTPATCLKKELRPLWESMIRSRAARLAARGVLEELNRVSEAVDVRKTTETDLSGATPPVHPTNFARLP